MTTSDDLSTGILLLGGGLAGYAAGRFLLSRVLDERERGAAPSVALTFAGSGPLALAAPATAHPLLARMLDSRRFPDSDRRMPLR